MTTVIVVVFLLTFAGIRQAAGKDKPPAPPPSPMDDCDGIFVQYQFNDSEKIYPHLKNESEQPYAFSAFLSVTNMGAHTLRSWRSFVGFNHGEILVSAPGAVLPDEVELPADVSNGTFFSGYPMMDLKTAIETAGDPAQYQVNITLTGTQFGVKPPEVPKLNNLSLANDGYSCPTATQGTDLLNKTMYVCCPYDGSHRYSRNETVVFLPRQTGDIELYYDVMQSFESSYFGQVTINNSNPLGRVDNWKLSWEWMRGEFISKMRGAYTLLRDASECIDGAQAKHYGKDVDFSQVMNCQRKPTIVDLPLGRYNDTYNGRIDYCCRNGSLLPYAYDPLQAKSRFLMQVYKMPPDLNITRLYPPENWKFNGSNLNVQYECGEPIRVSPSLFPDPSGLQSYTVAIASWQVVCNITRSTEPPVPHCCVSFSAYYNESVIPCKTCACGCRSNANCDPNAPALLLPPEALLVPFDNRTEEALAWAQINHFTVPNPLPCADNCGVSINWHVYTNYEKGWSARITIFNWDDTSVKDWFAAVVLDKAFLGYEKMYSFNGTAMTDPNNTIFMYGLVNHTYLLAVDKLTDPTKPPVPGKEQTIISFTKLTTPGIKVGLGDGFPSKVYFNGEECTLPAALPTNEAHIAYSMSLLSSILIAAVVFMLMDQFQ